ncbi:serine/threonine-protein phosphatase with EF-hands 2 [Ahaetulla prasina]|uniref:serine/threonine-protein phosphatase with EF-hands 2 n=1 Tax=Ahaetulla prasina TaxID=499056 RepID=UPI002648004A|nr:serine/threonine-protein phosphatase with EF-hands 2 [Ahaetulla prasina]
MEKKQQKKDGASDKNYQDLEAEKQMVKKNPDKYRGTLELPKWPCKLNPRLPHDTNAFDFALSLSFSTSVIKSAVLIQRWYRRFVARLEMRRRCTWRIFQSIEYAGEHDHIKLNHFFDYLMEHITPRNKKDRALINRILSETDATKQSKLEKTMESMAVPVSYKGPRLGFPLTPDDAVNVLEAFRNNQQLHPYYVLKLFHEVEQHLSQLPNINRISTCYSEEITVCGDLHGQIFDLFHIFYKNGLPSPQKLYVFNGDFVDRGPHSIEILIIIFIFLLIYPKEVHLNRGNHEDYMINFRYGFTKEVTRKYKDHAHRLLSVIKNVFSSIPLATVIDRKVFIVHGGISDKTDLDRLDKVERCKILSVLAPKRRRTLDYTASEGSKMVRSGSTISVPQGGQKSVQEDSKSAGKSPGVQKISGPSSSLDSEDSSESTNDDDDDIEQILSVLAPKRRRTLDYTASEGSKMVRSGSTISVPQGGQKSVQEDSKSAGKSPGVQKISGPSSSLDSEDSSESTNDDDDDIEQVIDILWSDPDSKPGCTENLERGGGCYFGPDVTDMFLRKHSLQFIIRSHECKPEGYEVDHNRKVITIFSASNYYSAGSNRGAYIKLGPDLIPHFVQFQATKGVSRQLNIIQRTSRVEESAYHILKEQLFAHRSELIAAFRGYDKRNTGLITVNDWAKAIESVLQLGLPWRMLRPHLILQLTNGKVDYKTWLKDIVTEEKSSIQERLQSSLLESIYRNLSNLETIFNLIDADCSGFICLEEFNQIWKLFSSHMNIDISDENIRDLARSIDFNKDGKIDFNEFLEAFRLVKQPTSQ